MTGKPSAQRPKSKAAKGALAALKPHSRHGIVTAVSMMKDEGPFLLEWIAHHLAVGFSRIVVYTNDCSDGTDLMLMRLEELGLAYHRRNDIPEGLRPQPSALNYAQEEPLVGESDWVLVFDADEFLCIKYGDGTLDPMLDAAVAQGANGIVITWRIFGSGGVHDWSRDPVTEQYLRAAPPDWNKGWGVKTLFKFDPDYWKLGIHRPKIKNKWLTTDFPDTIKWLNGSGRPMEDYFRFRGWRSITRTIGYDWAQMNHYAVKSIDSYAIRKFRGNVNLKKDKYNSDYWSLQDRNEVSDDTMLRYSAERKRIFDTLLTDPVLSDLHFKALDRAEARLAEFKGTDAYNEMVAGLKAASEVPITGVVAKPPQARDPEKIAALMSRVEKASGEKQKAERKAKIAVEGSPRPVLLVADPQPDGIAKVQWYPNHDIRLPADPRFFTSTGLDLIVAAKYERGLGRALPKLLSGAERHLEIGAGAGFRAALLARHFPQLKQRVHEPNDARARMIRAIWAENGIPADRIVMSTGPLDADSIAAMLAEHRPDCLMLGDGAPDGGILGSVLTMARFLPGRLILAGAAADHLTSYAAAFPALAAAIAKAEEPPANSDFIAITLPRSAESSNPTFPGPTLAG